MKTNAKPPVWAQGDVLIIRRSAPVVAPENAQATAIVLAEGEVTGHAHRVTGNARYWPIEGYAGAAILEALEAVTVTHDEHAPIVLDPGTYEVRIQREYAPGEIRRVQD